MADICTVEHSTFARYAATHLRRGGKFYSVFFCSSSQNAGVKELLKSVHVRQSYHKKTALVFFDSRRILFQTMRVFTQTNDIRTWKHAVLMF